MITNEISLISSITIDFHRLHRFSQRPDGDNDIDSGILLARAPVENSAFASEGITLSLLANKDVSSSSSCAADAI